MPIIHNSYFIPNSIPISNNSSFFVPTYPQEPVIPNQSANIDVRYDTQRVGIFSKTVTLTTNITEPTHTLTIKGEVKAPPTQESVPVSTGGLKR